MQPAKYPYEQREALTMTEPTANNTASHPDAVNSHEGRGVELDPRLLDLLVCPVTKAPLVYDRAAQELISRQAKLAYPVRDGIPIMLPDEARKLGD
jgi:uncharacterized protein YbaR (Trm112 family)